MKFDPDRLLTALTNMTEAAAEASTTHASARPSVPSDVAGHAYPETAKRLQKAVERLHRAGQVRIDAFHDDCVAAARQASALQEADENFSTCFGKEDL